MPSQRKRDQAVSSLKATLVARFGPDSREIVEAEVDGRLGSSAGKLTREDLDAIERSVLLAAKTRRGSQPPQTLRSNRSAPLLKQVEEGPRGLVPTPPARPTKAPSAPPSTAGSRDAVRISPVANKTAPARSLSAAAVISQKPALPPVAWLPEDRLPRPPYGISILEGGNQDGSERSCVQSKPKFNIPLRPKMKPMDHWDLIVAFDGFKHRQEDDSFHGRGKAASIAKVRGTLDGQMLEVQAQRDFEADLKRQDRDNMLAMLEENRRLKEAEHAKEMERRDEMKKITDEMCEGIERRRRAEQNRKKRDEEQMTQWLANEKRRRQQEEQAKAEADAKRNKAAKDEMQQALEDAARRKKEREAAEKTYVAEQQKGMDDKEAANRAAVQARMDQIERNCATLGAEIAGRDAELERRLQEQIRQVQEKADRDAKEDEARRKAALDARTKDMISTLNEQCKQRGLDAIREKEDNVKQARVWKEQYEQGLAKDKAEEAARRKARADLDKVLVDQMTAQIQVHPRNFLVSGDAQQTDVCLNRMIFEHMAAEGFMPELTEQMLKHAPQRGKIDRYPSVARYEGPIHPDELLDPEVS